MDSFTSAQSQNQRNKKRSLKANKKSECPRTVSVFLRKAFEMINSCDPSIASWSSDGLTFVVKNPKQFQNEIIPKYFKHNNLSSFVRQLNFYGFHKVKSDPLQLKDTDVTEESNYWRFHHQKFQRGRPDLLVEIRKPSQTEAAEKSEVDDLRSEISKLRDQVSVMASEMEGVKALFGGLLQGQQAPKRSKLSHESQPTVTSQPSAAFDFAPNQFSLEAIEPNPLPLPGSRYNRENNGLVDIVSQISGPSQANFLQEPIGTSVFSSKEEESMLTSIFALDPFDEIDVLEKDNNNCWGV